MKYTKNNWRKLLMEKADNGNNYINYNGKKYYVFKTTDELDDGLPSSYVFSADPNDSQLYKVNYEWSDTLLNRVSIDAQNWVDDWVNDIHKVYPITLDLEDTLSCLNLSEKEF